MRHVLSILHDANDAGLKSTTHQHGDYRERNANTYLGLMSSLFVNAISRLLSFEARLHLGNNSTDLDLLQRAGKLVVERERIISVDVSPRWVFLQYFVFGTSQ